MPFRKAPLTLRTLSLQTVRNHFINLQDIVSELPHVLIEDLLGLYEAKNYLLRNSRILSRIFIRHRTQNIPIETPIDRLTLSDVCKNLTHLNLIHNQMSPKCLENLVSNITSIKCLNLSNTCCTDSVLAAIGIHCAQLKSLDVSSCKITDAGIHSLCLNNESASRNLKITHLDITQTFVSWHGCLLVLTNFPLLKSFNFNSIDISTFDVTRFRSYSVEGIALGVVTTPKQLETAMVVFPKLHDFQLTCKHVLTFNAVIASCLITSGRPLTSIKLYRVSSVDLQLIGVSCPLLEVLILCDCHDCFENSGHLPALSNHVLFARLRRLELSCGDIAARDLRMLLVNCSGLEVLSITRCQSVTDGLISEVVRSNGLKCLEKLYLSSCNSFTQSSVTSLLEIHNPLCLLRLHYCANIKREDYLLIKAFVRTCNLNVWIIWVGRQ